MDLLRTGCICWASKTASLPWSISHIKALQFRKISLIGEILQDISLSNSTDIALMQTFMRVERIEGKIKPWLLFRFFKKFFIGISIIHLAECAKFSQNLFLILYFCRILKIIPGMLLDHLDRKP